MNALQKTFLSMIKTALWDMPYVCENTVKTADLFNEACRYGIAGILSAKLDLFCQKDHDTRARWSKKAMADYRKSLYMLSAQVSLCRILANEHIKPVILKGTASAAYYKNPLLRQMGDIDFLILPEQFDIGCNLLEENGYVKENGGTRHVAFVKQGIRYECHRYFSNNMTDEDRNEDQIIYAGCRNCETRSVEGKEFYTLPDAEYGIVLLEHLKNHLKDGVGFRQIMDWVVYADTVLDDTFWKSKFQKMASQCGLELLAKTITKMSQLYLGLKSDTITWCGDIDESICEAFIEMIFSCNNFGFINEDNENMHAIGNVFRTGFFKKLNSCAISHIPIAKNLVIIRPVAWLYQLIRWSIKGTYSLLHVGERSGLSPKVWQNQNEFLKQIGA